MNSWRRFAPALWLGLGLFQIIFHTIFPVETKTRTLFGVGLGVFMMIIGVAMLRNNKRING